MEGTEQPVATGAGSEGTEGVPAMPPPAFGWCEYIIDTVLLLNMTRLSGIHVRTIEEVAAPLCRRGRTVICMRLPRHLWETARTAAKTTQETALRRMPEFKEKVVHGLQAGGQQLDLQDVYDVQLQTTTTFLDEPRCHKALCIKAPAMERRETLIMFVVHDCDVTTAGMKTGIESGDMLQMLQAASQLPRQLTWGVYVDILTGCTSALHSYSMYGGDAEVLLQFASRDIEIVPGLRPVYCNMDAYKAAQEGLTRRRARIPGPYPILLPAPWGDKSPLVDQNWTMLFMYTRTLDKDAYTRRPKPIETVKQVQILFQLPYIIDSLEKEANGYYSYDTETYLEMAPVEADNVFQFMRYPRAAQYQMSHAPIIVHSIPTVATEEPFPAPPSLEEYRACNAGAAAIAGVFLAWLRRIPMAYMTAFPFDQSGCYVEATPAMLESMWTQCEAAL